MTGPAPHGRGGAPGSGLAHAAAEAAGQLPALLVEAERVVAAVAGGVHGRRRPGQGDSFWEYRPMREGEPASRIDWRRSARGARHFVRETEWEAAQTVCLWRASDPGMRWRSAASLPTKEERAAVLMLGLASLLLKGGERPRLAEGRHGLSPVSTGPDALRLLAARLAAGTGDAAMDAAVLPAYGRAVVFGDFLAPVAATRALVASLGARPVAATLVQVLDPAEIAFPFTGRLRFRAPEGAAAGELLAPRAEGLRDAYTARLAAHRDELAQVCARAGVGLMLHVTDATPVAALLALHQLVAARTR